MFASSATAANTAVWGPLLKWLDTDRPQQPIAPAGKPWVTRGINAPNAEHRTLTVELANDGDQAAKVEVIGRVLTWEHALVGDTTFNVDFPANRRPALICRYPMWMRRNIRL